MTNEAFRELAVAHTVNPRHISKDTKPVHFPWKRCSTGKECLEWVLNKEHDVRYTVSYLTKAHFLLQQTGCGTYWKAVYTYSDKSNETNILSYSSYTDELMVVKTKDSLYRFSGSWLYSDAVNAEWRMKIDPEIVSLRINGTVSCTPFHFLATNRF